MKVILAETARYSLLFAALCLLGLCGLLLLQRSPAEAGIALSASAICMVFFFLARFKRVKGFGLEAEMWEEKQEEAARIVAQLKEMAVLISQPVLLTAVKLGRWGGGYSNKQRHELQSQIHVMLLNMGVGTKEIDNLEQGYHTCTEFGMAQVVWDKLGKRCNEKIS